MLAVFVTILIAAGVWTLGFMSGVTVGQQGRPVDRDGGRPLLRPLPTETLPRDNGTSPGRRAELYDVDLDGGM